MPKEDIIAKLKAVNLLGRSGSNFPTGLKWETVKNTKAPKKYIICNASEGEPEVFKDEFILKNHPQELIKGIKIALETIDNSKAIIYINKNYYQKYALKLKKLIGRLPISIFKKTAGYIGGEETSAIESIEGKLSEPRKKPPFPTKSGLFGYPTLVNNVETFYYVSKIVDGRYRNSRLYCITGDVKNKGVFEFPESWTIKKVLERTANWPDFDFFAQVGGGGEGEIFLPGELNQAVKSLASIIIYNRKNTDPFALMEKWAEFLTKGNCDKCAPCREGTFRIWEMIKEKNLDKNTLEDLFLVLEETSFCPLGRGAATPFKSLISKILKNT